MRNAYYIYYPRNFANEFSLFSVCGDKEENLIRDLISRISENPNAECHRISRKQAFSMAAENRKAYRTGEANAQNPAGATEIISISEWGCF